MPTEFPYESLTKLQKKSEKNKNTEGIAEEIRKWIADGIKIMYKEIFANKHFNGIVE